jgi:hypothetical protein
MEQAAAGGCGEHFRPREKICLGVDGHSSVAEPLAGSVWAGFLSIWARPVERHGPMHSRFLRAISLMGNSADTGFNQMQSLSRLRLSCLYGDRIAATVVRTRGLLA